MNKWMYLALAICSEVLGSMSLKAALDNPLWYVTVVAGYTGAFLFLSAVLRFGMPIGVAYGIWAALGISLTAILSTLIFSEPFTFTIGLGIVLIIFGVLLIELGSHSREHDGAKGESA